MAKGRGSAKIININKLPNSVSSNLAFWNFSISNFNLLFSFIKFCNCSFFSLKFSISVLYFSFSSFTLKYFSFTNSRQLCSSLPLKPQVLHTLNWHNFRCDENWPKATNSWHPFTWLSHLTNISFNRLTTSLGAVNNSLINRSFLQLGHVFRLRSHSSIHVLQYVCWQQLVTIGCLYNSWHIPHENSSSSFLVLPTTHSLFKVDILFWIISLFLINFYRPIHVQR